MRRSASWNNAIWGVNALLAIGIIGFSFRYIFLADGGPDLPENPPAPTVEQAATDRGLDEFKTIWEAQLVPPAQGPARPVEQKPTIKFDGTFGSQYLFVINGQNGQGKVGGPIEVSDGQGVWQAVSVNGKKVLLKEVNRDKAIFYLEGEPADTWDVPVLDSPGGGVPGPGNPGPQGGPPEPKAPELLFRTKQAGEKTWKVDPRERDFVRQRAPEMIKDVRWSLYGVEGGKAKGVRIDGFAEGSYAEEFAKARGVHAGDIILTLNGRTIDGAETVNELFGDGEAWAQGQARVEIERAGKVQVLSYSVQ